MALFGNVCETLKALPVTAVAADVVQSVLAGKVTVLAAPTGSGKSMLVPAMLADATDEEVVVLVPRRFLATDAATNVAQMAGCELGDAVGYSIGKMAGESSKISANTKLRFVTYGYAISSGLIKTAKNIVLDEVHEGAEDISLARAILYERKQAGDDFRLLEMSATVDARKQAGYWKPVVGETGTAVHSVEGQTLVCEERRETPGRDSDSIAATAIKLLKNEGRKGIAIFRSGIKDIEKTVEELQDLVKNDPALKDVEVVQIYGGTPADERDKARAAPKEGCRKIIVGTNVIESGVNLRWVDAGISDGFGKIPYDRFDTGAEALVQEHLPQWRIVQQRGRINRAPDVTGKESGIFILHSNKEMAQRPQQATAELSRRSLTHIAFRAACLGYHPEQLHFDADVTPERMTQAKEELIRLGLVDEHWGLTADGKYASRLPLSPETAAILCEARRMDIAAARSGDKNLRDRPKLLGDAIIMAAIIEQKGLREDYKRGHGFEGKSDVHGGSDVLDGLKAYLQLEPKYVAKVVADSATILASGDETRIAELVAAREALKKECLKDGRNVSFTDLCDVMLLVGEIRARHEKDAKSIETDRSVEPDAARYNALKQTLLNGNVNRLFQMQQGGDGAITYRDLLRDFGNRKSEKGEPFSSYRLNEYSALRGEQETAVAPLLVGTLKELPPKRTEPAAGGERAGVKAKAPPPAEPALALDQVTSIPAEVFMAWAAGRDQALLSQIEFSRKADGGELSARYAGKAAFAIPTPKLLPEMAEHLSTLKEKSSWAQTIDAPEQNVAKRGR